MREVGIAENIIKMSSLDARGAIINLQGDKMSSLFVAGMSDYGFSEVTRGDGDRKSGGS